MSADVREELAAALRHITVSQITVPENHLADNLADALLPVVERLCNQRAAEALEEAAVDHDQGKCQRPVGGWLHARAAALKATP